MFLYLSLATGIFAIDIVFASWGRCAIISINTIITLNCRKLIYRYIYEKHIRLHHLDLYI